MAVLFPALQRVRKQARSLVCRAHLKQWGQVFALYLEDHEGRFRRDDQYSDSILRGIYTGSDADPNNPSRYHGVRTEGIVLCPMASKTTESLNDSARLIGGGVFLAWEMKIPAPPFRGSYGVNLYPFTSRFQFNTPPRLAQDHTHVFSLRGRDRIPLLLDMGNPSGGMTRATIPPPSKEPAGTDTHLCINRHNGPINGLFLDWSVRDIGLKELWTLKWHLDFDTAGRWTKAGGVQPEDWPEWMRKFKDY